MWGYCSVRTIIIRRIPLCITTTRSQSSSPLAQRKVRELTTTAKPAAEPAFQSLFGPSFYSFPRYRLMDLPPLTDDPSSWTGSSLLSVNQITPPGLHLLFAVAQEMRSLVLEKGGDRRLEHKIVSTVFYEASTRTACSFQAAMMRLGGSHVSQSVFESTQRNMKVNHCH